MDENKGQGGDALRFAALMAHQLRSPVNAVATQLDAVLGGYAGTLTHRQRELLERAAKRCREAREAIGRMMAIVEAMEGVHAPDTLSDLCRVARRVEGRFIERMLERGIAFEVALDLSAAPVRGEPEVLAEVLGALVSNAWKYTPDHGRIRLRVGPGTRDDAVAVSVGDSGVGIPEEARDRVFEPFYRTPGARDSARSGVGLGLAFVKAVVDRAGGRVSAGAAPLGGAEISIELPLEAMPDDWEHHEVNARSKVMRVVIVGGVAAGPKVASKVIRLDPSADVTVFEKGKFLSYAGCGLPYYVSGIVKEHTELMSTPAGAVRDPVFFQRVKNVHVKNHTEVLEIDRAGKRVRARDLLSGEEWWQDYDKLVLATGATPVAPPIKGLDLDNVFALHGVNDAEGIRAVLSREKAHDVVVIGGGLIGVEVTEALVEKGCRVTMVEMTPQILRMLDWEIARLVEQHMESKGVKVMTSTRATAFESDAPGGPVRRVVTDKGVLPADMVILGIGVRPNVALAQAAGLEIGVTHAIRVDNRQQTSDPDIYAAGDCAETRDIQTGEPCYIPLGSTANKQGRVAAINVCGGDDTFPGVLGSTVCRVFDYCVARTGMTETTARRKGHEIVTALSPAPDRAHYMPDARLLMLKLVVDARTRRVLGAQATGPGAGDKRMDVVAMAITAGMTVDDLAKADLCYAPPYSPAMDNIITAADVVRNKLSGAMDGITPMETYRLIQERPDELILLDVRSPAEYETVRLPGSINIPLGALRGRLDELDRSKTIIAFCKISLRGYEAALILRHAGFPTVKVLDGGIAMWPYDKTQ